VGVVRVIDGLVSLQLWTSSALPVFAVEELAPIGQKMSDEYA